MNRLYYGDCMTIMRDHMGIGGVDLIYLDPPFNSNQEYNAIYKDETGRPLPDQIEAFCDLWELDAERERALRTMPVLMRENGVDDETTEFWRLWMNALRKTQPRLLAYLSYMVERLLYMKKVLKPTGSIYLHCDPTASHYIKVMMDAVFGHSRFQNEIIWKRTFSHGSAKRYGTVHDTILFYTAGMNYQWTGALVAHDPTYLEKRFRTEDARGRYQTISLTGPGTTGGDSGKQWRGFDPTSIGRHWAVPSKALEAIGIGNDEQPSLSTAHKLDALDAEEMLVWPAKKGSPPRLKHYAHHLDGVAPQDVWTDIPPVNSQAKERMGYATQKPVSLLERIIRASSNPGDVVFDPFCGCASTLEAAHNLGRQWIGIDIAIHAVKRVASIRLRDRLGLSEGKDFVIEGVPRNVEGARDLWERDKYHFQKWAVEQVDGFVTTKRTADGGVDGRLYFAVPGEHDLQSMAIEVKGGRNVTIESLRALRGVLDNDVAIMAGLIIMEPLGTTKERNFRRFMADAGDYAVSGIPYPRMQTLTVEQILGGATFYTPGVSGRGLEQPVLEGTIRPQV